MQETDFQKRYREITALVSDEMNKFDELFKNFFNERAINNSANQIVPILKDFFAEKGKRLRPLIIFLFCKAANIEITQSIFNIALVNELIHNSTLIHDDIIDCAVLRRNKKTLNFDYDSKLAVLAGDYLLCEALKLIVNIENPKIQKIYADNLLAIINGELYQYFNRFKVCSIVDYVEKSKNKTAKLFELGLLSCLYLDKAEQKQIDCVIKFALNFGIAFQINNDLKKFSNTDKFNEDIQNGDYSAPIIYYVEDKLNGDITKLKNIDKLSKKLQNSSAIEKTNVLKNQHIKLAIENLTYLEDNQYKKVLIELCNLF